MNGVHICNCYKLTIIVKTGWVYIDVGYYCIKPILIVYVGVENFGARVLFSW